MMYYPTATHDNWTQGHIDPVWIEDQYHKTFNYVNKPFNDVDTLLGWQNIGHLYENYTGDIVEWNDLPDCVRQLAGETGLANMGVSLYKMKPGRIIPEHQDTYDSYRKVFDISDEQHIKRYVVFLEDWASGHYLEVAGDAIINWKAGDWVSWDDDTPHLAANIGSTDRYTMQITGTY